MDPQVKQVLRGGDWNRLTERAETTVALGMERADSLGHTKFNSCHLLSGLLQEGRGVAAHVLDGFDLSQSQIDHGVSRTQPVREDTFQIDHDDIRIVMEAAFVAAGQMNHHYAGTEHLLIGTTAAGSKSAQLLQDLGISLSEVRREVASLLGHVPLEEDADS